MTHEPTPAAAWTHLAPLQEYWLDAWQRSILTLDILRERGNTFWERADAEVIQVLTFDAELILDGRELSERPVNYLLARIIPPDDKPVDRARRPFIVVDPRAGHGPGIGGMKTDSEIGVAMAAGHPCYFIGFLPQPVPGQTIEDVCRAEAMFIEEVARRHPEAEGKPVVIANCQAGWQTMMMAAIKPDVTGPIMLAGSPLSYWAGARGVNPMRYTGGMLGGTWMTALAGDLGGGLFDGAHLVRNFESLDPANTWWEKPYNVYAKADTEGPRFLDFETWWGSPVLMNAEEMQWIADNLFVGNKLTSGHLRTRDGVRVDLRNIKSPIIVFCSFGDNITPPQQALGWITDLYDNEREIVANGQTIVYSLHQSIGHLGIFVSGKVATKEHSEFTACMDLIDLMPPGLYEAVITEADPAAAPQGLVNDRYLFRLEPRVLDDIRALGGNSPQEEQRFATLARVSEVNKALYMSLFSPTVRAAVTPPLAETLRQMHPNRLRFGLISDTNPLMQPIAAMAQEVRKDRSPVSPDNPYLVLEKTASEWIGNALTVYGKARDTFVENLFMGVYGAPIVRAAVGLRGAEAAAGPRIERDLVREADEVQLRSSLEKRFEAGDPLDAALRALVYVSRPEGAVDERSFAVLSKFHEAQPADQRQSLARLREIMREQALLVRLDEDRAIKAIPKLLPKNAQKRQESLAALHSVVEGRGQLAPESRRRLNRVDALFA